jgi:SAM-dependent methyltransferase
MTAAADALQMETVKCCICGTGDAFPVGSGEDFEYRSSPDTFVAVRCRRCDLVYLNPRPAPEELGRIYPPHYHAYQFTAEKFGLAYRVRSRLEARRLLSYAKGLPKGARILDIGCGDGFHLDLLKQYGDPTWQLVGVDVSERAVSAARRRGLNVYQGRVDEADLPAASFDLILMIATIEHVDDPAGVVAATARLLTPQGRAVIVTDNADSLDFRLAHRRHWGGYHFPRHWNLFNRRSMELLAARACMRVTNLETSVTPVNWVYTIHNWLADHRAPSWLLNRFGLASPVSLGIFTILDMVLTAFGRGGLLRATLANGQLSARDVVGARIA